MSGNQKSFLTTEEIQILLNTLRKKTRGMVQAEGEDPDEQERKYKEYYSLMECATIRDLLIKKDNRDRWDAVSEYFRIPFEVLCAMSAVDGDLLFIEWTNNLSSTDFTEYFPLDFEKEQRLTDMDREVEQAGGIIKYLEKRALQKQKKPVIAPTTPLLPKQKYRQ